MNRRSDRTVSNHRGRMGREKNRKYSNTRYQLKAAYDENKRIYTVLDISADSTLDDLCIMILDAFDFTHEHLYLFNFDGTGYGEGDYVYYFMPESGEKGTDIRLGELDLVLKQKFYFLYDFGDDWGFQIQVQKIYETEEHVINGIVSVKGELQQYPEWDEDDRPEEWDEDNEMDFLDEEELEKPFGFQISREITVREILDTLEEDDLRMHAAAFLGDEERSACLVEKDIDWVRERYAQAVLQNREHMLLFLRNTAAEVFLFLMTAGTDSESGILNWDDFKIELPIEEEIYSQEVSVALMHLYSMGACMPEMDNEGMVHSFLISQEMRDAYEKWISRPSVGKKLQLYKKVQEIVDVLLLRYGIVEMDKLHEICQDVLGKKIKKEDLEFLINGRLVYFGRYDIYTSEEGVLYVSVLDEAISGHILCERKQYPDLTYQTFSLKELENYIENGPYWDVEGYDELMDALWKTVQDVQALGMMLQSFTNLAVVGVSADDIIRAIRSELNSSGKRMTKKLQGMIRDAVKNMPLAARYGYKAEK